MQRNGIKLVGATWGIAGVILLLVFAMWRLAPFAYALTNFQLSWLQWLVLVAWSAFMIYSEGIRAFGKQFSPRAVARAQYLATQSRLSWRQLLLAPLFCMSYFHAPKRRVITSYILTVGIIMIIALVHFVPQPWRGVIDSGVVLGLFYGTMTLFYFSVKGLRQRGKLIADPEVL